MPITLPLEEMTLTEKLDAMEALWVDLSRDSKHFESPVWHASVLRERQREIDSGDARFLDWEEAKELIRRRTQ